MDFWVKSGTSWVHKPLPISQNMGIGMPNKYKNFERMGLHTHLPIGYLKKRYFLIKYISDILHFLRIIMYTKIAKTAKMLFENTKISPKIDSINSI